MLKYLVILPLLAFHVSDAKSVVTACKLDSGINHVKKDAVVETNGVFGDEHCEKGMVAVHTNESIVCTSDGGKLRLSNSEAARCSVGCALLYADIYGYKEGVVIAEGDELRSEHCKDGLSLVKGTESKIECVPYRDRLVMSNMGGARCYGICPLNDTDIVGAKENAFVVEGQLFDDEHCEDGKHVVKPYKAIRCNRNEDGSWSLSNLENAGCSDGEPAEFQPCYTNGDNNTRVDIRIDEWTDIQPEHCQSGYGLPPFRYDWLINCFEGKLNTGLGTVGCFVGCPLENVEGVKEDVAVGEGARFTSQHCKEGMAAVNTGEPILCERNDDGTLALSRSDARCSTGCPIGGLGLSRVHKGAVVGENAPFTGDHCEDNTNPKHTEDEILCRENEDGTWSMTNITSAACV